MNTPKNRWLTRNRAWATAWLALAFVLSGCATTATEGETVDTWENANRGIYKFNDKVDKAILKPVAETYQKVTPAPVRRSVTNFFENVAYLNVILNDLLQAKLEQGIADTTRFVYNSVFGVAGLFDVARHMGLPPNDEDFGQTLGVWGLGEGAYVVLPILGPSTLRDVPDLVVSSLVNPLSYIDNTGVRAGLTALDGVDTRARASGAFAFINEAALDPYIFTREAYLQRRIFLIYDGNPPKPKFFDDLEDIDEEP